MKKDDDDDKEQYGTPAAKDKSTDDSPKLAEAASPVPTVPENSSAAVANELFAQLAEMKGR